MSDKKFNHVHNVWNKFEMNKMKDYHDMYLKCDVLLLVDVFEKFRNNSLKNYRLFPSHYLGAAALTWDAMFNMTKWNSNLFQILACLYSLKKLPLVEFLIDIVKPTISIGILWLRMSQNIYLDANNLYGYGMPKFRSRSGFTWIDPKVFDVNKYTSNSWKGYGLKIDLEYPKELKELHNDYPLVPDKI